VLFQFLLTPEETVMTWGGREIRHIYTDGRGHPSADDVWPTPWGDSVGYWEGQALVVDTAAVQPSRFPYERVTDLDHMVHGLCDEDDRNPIVDGKLTIAPPEN